MPRTRDIAVTGYNVFRRDEINNHLEGFLVYTGDTFSLMVQPFYA